MILCEGELILSEHLPPDMGPRSGEKETFNLPFGLTLDVIEREYLLASLKRNNGNKARTADRLGISEKTLYNKLNRYAAEARAAQREGAGLPEVLSTDQPTRVPPFLPGTPGV